MLYFYWSIVPPITGGGHEHGDDGSGGNHHGGVGANHEGITRFAVGCVPVAHQSDDGEESDFGEGGGSKARQAGRDGAEGVDGGIDSRSRGAGAGSGKKKVDVARRGLCAGFGGRMRPDRFYVGQVRGMRWLEPVVASFQPSEWQIVRRARAILRAHEAVRASPLARSMGTCVARVNRALMSETSEPKLVLKNGEWSERKESSRQKDEFGVTIYFTDSTFEFYPNGTQAPKPEAKTGLGGAA